MFSTLSALAGTVVGGLTSFVTSWFVQNSQAKAARLAAERNKREELYGRFMDELARLYSQALTSELREYSSLVAALALRGRITLTSGAEVVEAAERAMMFIVDLYLGPNRTAAEMRAMLDDPSNDMISDFARCCRAELQRIAIVRRGSQA